MTCALKLSLCQLRLLTTGLIIFCSDVEEKDLLLSEVQMPAPVDAAGNAADCASTVSMDVETLDDIDMNTRVTLTPDKDDQFDLNMNFQNNNMLFATQMILQKCSRSSTHPSK